VPLLAGLLANEADQALSFEAFFMTVQQIVHNKIIYVFHAASCSLLNVYLPDESRYIRSLHTAAAGIDSLHFHVAPGTKNFIAVQNSQFEMFLQDIHHTVVNL